MATESETEKLTIHQLLRRGAARYVAEHGDGQASPHVQNVLAKISLCRTAELGGRWYQCDDCQGITKLYNSCGDRHCPGCGGAKRADWSESASQLLLSGVDYYQLIFTLPKILSNLALANRKEMADVLFQSAWKAIGKGVRGEQGYDPAALMVLHTWNQKLDAHWHVHALVPGGGPNLVDGSWTESERPLPAGFKPAENDKYLVDATNLRTAFRKFAIAHVKRLRRAGKLSFGGSLEYLREDDQWEALIGELESTEWVSHIEPPPGAQSRPEHIVRYLTRYLTGGPISDYRITAADDQTVTFMARQGNVTGGEREQVPHTLETPEFIRRWALHIQSPQLTKTRQFGGWSSTHKEQYMASCRSALAAEGIVEPDTGPESESGTDRFSGDETERVSLTRDHCPLTCEHCGSESLRLVKEIAKPTWKQLLSARSESCPPWYAESQKLEERAFWDAAMGEGFSDWYDEYLETEAESAKESQRPRKQSSQQQLALPGMEPAGIYQTDSF